MKTSEAGLALIRKFEGFRAEAYLDPVGVPTIGYGSTAGVKLGQTVTMAEANNLLRDDVAVAEDGINRLISVPLEQNQFDALVSWAFNVGVGAVERSTLRRRLNAGDYAAVPSELMRWTKAGGADLPGLVRRRREECALWRGIDREGTVGGEAKPDEPKLKPVSESKSMKGGTVAVTTGVAAGGTILSSILGALTSETAQIIAVCLIGVAVAGAAYALRDRWLMRVRGER